jgi:cytochrome c553
MSHRHLARWSITTAAMLFAVACHHAASATNAAPSPGTMTRGANAAPALPAGVTVAMITKGDSLFNNGSCKKCHEMGGAGGVRGPNLTDQTWIHIDGSYPAIVNLVTTGFTKADQKDPQYPFTMNPRGGSHLTDDQIAAVAAYVWTLSRPGAR